MRSILAEEELSEFLANAISLKERCQTKNTHHWSNVSCDLESNKITVTLRSTTWESLGKILLQTYKSVIPAKNLASTSKCFNLTCGLLFLLSLSLIDIVQLYNRATCIL